jgi:hypothetical protein
MQVVYTAMERWGENIVYGSALYFCVVSLYQNILFIVAR